MSASNSDIVPDTSLSLIERVRSGCDEAWAQLVELYSPLIYSKCRHKHVRPDDSAEILQDVFLRVHLSIGRYRPQKKKASFRSWLRVVTGNVLADHFRAMKKRHRELDNDTLTLQLRELTAAIVEDDDSADLSPVGSTAPRDAALIMSRAIQVVKGEFENRTWTAFWMFAVEGNSARQVGEDLGMGEGAVRQAKYVVRKRLEQELDGLI